ncbi:MAG: EAL domain-containing protein [Rhodocyclales bacterium]|nr:EAL domain-containing protein [Rhodocyclales bacterium]
MQVDTYHRIKYHSLWLLAAFFMVLSLLSGRNIHEKLADESRALVVHKWAEANAGSSVLIHELQLERGLSSGYVASNGKFFADVLVRQGQATEEAFAATLPVLLGDRQLRAYLEARHPAALSDLLQLGSLRQLVSELVLSREATVDRYSAMIEMLFDVMNSTLVTDSGTLRPQLAFLAFLQAKEMAGQERALLTAILSSRDFGSYSRMAAYHRIRAVEELAIKRFLQFADEDARAGFAAIATQTFAREAEAIRRRVVAAGHSAAATGDNLPSPEHWFRVSSERIDAMKALEHLVGGSVTQSADTLRQNANAGLAVSALSAMASFLLGGLLLLQLRHGSRVAEKDLHLAATVFGNSVESIIITDAQSRIVDVNRSFTRTTGYRREEVLGQPARMLKSGRNDGGFYAGMWGKLLESGSWEGEVSNRRKNGEIYPALLSIVAVKDIHGTTTNYVAMIVDISKRRKAEGQLERLRTFDSLTGSLTREAWLSVMDRAVANTRVTHQMFAMLEIGIDRFKLINASLGHAVGDKVLTEAADRIGNALRRQDPVARPGGDRFSVLIEDVASSAEVDAICGKLLAAFEPPMRVDERELQVSISIGVALHPDDGEDAATLQRNAEAAMYRAKLDGGGGYAFFAADMNAEGAQRLTLERMLRLALDRDEFVLNYQPQIAAGSGQLVGVEALLRWNSGDPGTASPVQFIPVAEETGLILPIGEWVLRSACADAQHWRECLGRDLPVAVNLSARQFRRKDLLAAVQAVLDETGLPSRLLELEITESLLVVDPVGAAEVLGGLRAMGVRTALDDFGTGYSSLAYLKTFPIDRLKIDRAFVRDLPDDQSDKAISRAVVALGLNLDMEVLAEGVETEAQRDFLAAEGCQVFQGFLFGQPMPAETLLDRIRSGALSL